MDVLMIGCGASGAAAAIAAAEAGHRVTVIDRNRKPLKKLGVTGNGRGNLMNDGPLRFYGDEAFAEKVLDCMPRETVRQFLQNLGLSLTADEEGRVYPSCFMASVAVDAFLARLAELGVSIRQNVQVESITPTANGFRVTGTESLYAPSTAKKNGKVKKGDLLEMRPVHFSADRVILAAGGAAAPAHGTDGSAYSLATRLGHRLIQPVPALSPLLTKTEMIRGLEGVRVKASLRLVSAAGDALHETSGEALFTAEGVSGIAAMQLSRFVTDDCTLVMNLTESLTGSPDTDVPSWLENRIRQRGHLPANQLLVGAALPALQNALLSMAGIGGTIGTSAQLTKPQQDNLCRAITGFSLPVVGARGFDAAQVTAGGIDTADVNPATLESRLVPGLYLTGEILNVDGDCGGFNLLFAFASGLLSGKSL